MVERIPDLKPITKIRWIHGKSKSRINQYVRDCAVCGNKIHKRRLNVGLEQEDGVVKTVEICCALSGDRSVVEELNASWAAKGYPDKMMSYSELYPLCFQEIFGKDVGVVSCAGKPFKQLDKEYLCKTCGTSDIMGGIWVSDVHVKYKGCPKTVLCEKCAVKKLNEKIVQ